MEQVKEWYVMVYKEAPQYGCLTQDPEQTERLIAGKEGTFNYMLIVPTDAYTLSEAMTLEEATEQAKNLKPLVYPWTAHEKQKLARHIAFDRVRGKLKPTLSNISKWNLENKLSDWEQRFYDAGTQEATDTRKPLTLTWLINWLKTNPEPSAV